MPSEAKSEGDAIHDKVFEMERVSRDQLIEHIERKPIVASTFTCVAQLGNIRVIGRPDAIVFLAGRPRWIVELKTTMGDVGRVWPDQTVQVEVYGLLLDTMGFDISKLELVLTRVNREAFTDEKERARLLGSITDRLLAGDPERLEKQFRGRLKFHLTQYKPENALRSVRWAQDYWLGRRDAIPSRSYGKCKACEYSNVCKYSLYSQKLPGRSDEAAA